MVAAQCDMLKSKDTFLVKLCGVLLNGNMNICCAVSLVLLTVCVGFVRWLDSMYESVLTEYDCVFEPCQVALTKLLRSEVQQQRQQEHILH